MGCNFYWKDVEADSNEDLLRHIGKRSAAGQYCWDCGITLVARDSRDVHFSSGQCFDECPNCGATLEGDLTRSTAAVELGFAEPTEVPRKGITSASSFVWTMMRHKWYLQALVAMGDEEKRVIDEYGSEYTAAEFLDNALASVAIETQYAGVFS